MIKYIEQTTTTKVKQTFDKSQTTKLQCVCVIISV